MIILMSCDVFNTSSSENGTALYISLKLISLSAARVNYFALHRQAHNQFGRGNKSLSETGLNKK